MYLPISTEGHLGNAFDEQEAAKMLLNRLTYSINIAARPRRHIAVITA